MPRSNRLRPDYQRITYSYACTLLHPIPETLWTTARAMQTLWNRLVAAHDILVETLDPDTPKDVKYASYGMFWHEAYLIVRDEGERLALTAWPKWHIYDTFRLAQQAWARGRANKPKIHHGLRQIIIPHRMQSGGVPVEWLWRDGPDKHTAILPPLVGHHWRDGYMTVGGERIAWRILLHREVPTEAILKRVALTGRFEPSLRHQGDDGWRWSVLLSLEIPPWPSAEPTGRSMGLDVGWRVRKTGLRVAVVTDGTRAWELLLPWENANRQLRRRQQHYASKDGVALETTGNWRRLWTWQSEIDQALEACKAALRSLDHTTWPEEARQMWQGHVRMRSGGLRRLARVLLADGCTVTCLDEWLVRHAVSQRRFRGAQLHILNQRKALYRLFAEWIARYADVVSWEGDLNLKTLAEADVTGNAALQQARKYRQMAGLTQLRQYIHEALAKRGRQVVDHEAAYTTQRCSVEGCLGVITPGADLFLYCSEGHGEDQDVNAARVLWQDIPHSQRTMSRHVPLVDRDALHGRLVGLA